MKIFELIKNNNFDDLFKLIKSGIDIDIYDSQNNHLLHLLILTNQYKIIEYILKNNSLSLDIYDNDGRNILYNVIKFDNHNILDLLLDYDNNNIGVPIIEKKDKNGDISINYTITLNNFNMFQKLYDISDLMLINHQKKNSIDICFDYDRTKFLKFVFSKISDFSFLSMNNNSLLQLAFNNDNDELIKILLEKNINFNNQELEYGLNILHQCIILDKTQYLEQIISKIDINQTDFIGNNALHYCIYEKNLNIAKQLIKFDINLNQQNDDGDTPLHLLFKLDKVDYEILDYFLINTNLNLQNNDMKSITHYLIENNLLYDEHYLDILKNKEINLFLLDNQNRNLLEILNNNPKIINIVAHGYYNSILNNKDKLNEKWEIECANTKNKDKCIKKIIQTIKDGKRSIPLINTFSIDLDYKDINTCYYVGTNLDVLFGLVYLKEKFDIEFGFEYPLTENKKLENYYQQNGLENRLDFYNINIVWSYQKLFYPNNFVNLLIDKIKLNKFIIIPLHIETQNGAHANFIIINPNKKEIERYEPNGSNHPNGFYYNDYLLDQLLKIKFDEINSDFKYITPRDYSPTIGLQYLEIMENNKCKKITDPNGFCALWCVFFAEQRLLNKKINSNQLLENIILSIKINNKSFKNMIRSYSSKITKLRDNYLIKYHIDINDWVNNLFDESIISNIENDVNQLLFN